MSVSGRAGGSACDKKCARVRRRYFRWCVRYKRVGINHDGKNKYMQLFSALVSISDYICSRCGGTELISDTVTVVVVARKELQITVTVAVAARKDRK